MTLSEKIEAYKKLHRNNDHVFRNGTKCQKLHTFLDMVYKDAVNEFKTVGTKNNADFLLELLK